MATRLKHKGDLVLASWVVFWCQIYTIEIVPAFSFISIQFSEARLVPALRLQQLALEPRILAWLRFEEAERHLAACLKVSNRFESLSSLRQIDLLHRADEFRRAAQLFPRVSMLCTCCKRIYGYVHLSSMICSFHVCLHNVLQARRQPSL